MTQTTARRNSGASSTNKKKRSQKSMELETELRRLVDKLDDFQSKVEDADDDNSSPDNEQLGMDLEQLLEELDVFQLKLEEADSDDMVALQELLEELQDKMTLGDEKETDLTVRKDTKRIKTAERQLKLYSHNKAKSGWAAFDSPQAKLLQNVVDRKKEERRRSKSWLGSLFSPDEDPADPSEEDLAKKLELQESNSIVLDALRESNKKLKQTVSRLEDVILRMEEAFKAEINTYQKVIMKLQRENIELHYRVEALSGSNGDPLTSPNVEKPTYSPSFRETIKAIYDLEKSTFIPLKIF